MIWIMSFISLVFNRLLIFNNIFNLIAFLNWFTIWHIILLIIFFNFSLFRNLNLNLLIIPIFHHFIIFRFNLNLTLFFEISLILIIIRFFFIFSIFFIFFSFFINLFFRFTYLLHLKNRFKSWSIYIKLWISNINIEFCWL